MLIVVLVVVVVVVLVVVEVLVVVVVVVVPSTGMHARGLCKDKHFATAKLLFSIKTDYCFVTNFWTRYLR